MCGHLLRIEQLKSGRYGTEHAGWLQGTSSPKGQPRRPDPGETRNPVLPEPPATPTPTKALVACQV